MNNQQEMDPMTKVMFITEIRNWITKIIIPTTVCLMIFKNRKEIKNILSR